MIAAAPAGAEVRCGGDGGQPLQPAEAFQHCPRCGKGPGVEVRDALLACASCGFHLHFNPAVAAGAFVLDEDGRVLLLKRAQEPARGAFGVPGGFVDFGETAEQAVLRETREETGLQVQDVRYLGGWPNLYPWRGVDYPVLDLFFTARAAAGQQAHAREEVEACVWMRPDEIDPATLAFPSTRAAVARLLGVRSCIDGPTGTQIGVRSCIDGPTGTHDLTPVRALHVVLVEPEIHWNTGNAGRSCLAAGAQLHLVEPLGFSLEERELRRAGLDYWERVAPRVWSSWDAFEAVLPQLGEPFFASPDGERPYWDARFPQRSVLVFGRESAGLPSRLRERYRERLLKLPMHDPALRSVNVSTCVGILLSEVLRQWQSTAPSP